MLLKLQIIAVSPPWDSLLENQQEITKPISRGSLGCENVSCTKHLGGSGTTFTSTDGGTDDTSGRSDSEASLDEDHSEAGDEMDNNQPAFIKGTDTVTEGSLVSGTTVGHQQRRRRARSQERTAKQSSLVTIAGRPNWLVHVYLLANNDAYAQGRRCLKRCDTIACPPLHLNAVWPEAYFIISYTNYATSNKLSGIAVRAHYSTTVCLHVDEHRVYLGRKKLAPILERYVI
ncbi:unnamed protein product [Protopolystoma xenopodis]|uniref:Uncharacterized protein n=1 Tax=Protopolystoma xenopodis TaxID=117903 RepID=A0A448XCJ6_9PLAT|nr:unnamed protein product [Protopolystoma xenopodis]